MPDEEGECWSLFASTAEISGESLFKAEQVCWSQSRVTSAAPHLSNQALFKYSALSLPVWQIVASASFHLLSLRPLSPAPHIVSSTLLPCPGSCHVPSFQPKPQPQVSSFQPKPQPQFPSYQPKLAQRSSLPVLQHSREDSWSCTPATGLQSCTTAVWLTSKVALLICPDIWSTSRLVLPSHRSREQRYLHRQLPSHAPELLHLSGSTLERLC
ncbi:uncharacterized protein LOC121894479 [Thunnus maccoyii]|uniref:uncharacterized protein LOC121894479 n=1 Tax=Thunnus maccoyii TaxID=8240 RepID=UPI001C4C0465|nr:uncharacterized protein LOC121894479 [Thunnus maccoyii]